MLVKIFYIIWLLMDCNQINFYMKTVILSLFGLCVFMKTLHAQQINMTVPPNKINFSASSPTVSSLPGASTSQYAVSNGAYDESNNLLFYIEDENVYNSSGNYVAALNGYTPIPYGDKCYGAIQNEIAIAPVPNTCNRFYVIYLMHNMCGPSPLSGVALLYSLVEVNGSSISMISNGNRLNIYGGNYSGLAVGTIRDDNTRDLYVVGYGKLDLYQISDSGISFTQTLSSNASGVNYQTLELELAPDGTKIAWGDPLDNKLYVARFNPDESLGTINIHTISAGVGNQYGIYGIEFNADASKIYGSCPGFKNMGGYGITVGGIFYYDLIASSTTFINLDGAYSNTQIELVKDGNLYFADTDGSLMSLNPSTNTISTFSPATTLYSNGVSGPSGYFFRLPDQIDGEDYNYFFGYPKVSGSFEINGEVPNPTAKLDVYTCSAIALSGNYQHATGYRVTIQSATSTGVTTSEYRYDYPSSTGYVTSLPADLRTLDGSYLSNASHAGKYYTITVTATDNCSKTITVSGLVQLNAIAFASSSFSFNPGNGVLGTPSTDYSSPNQLGYYGLGINASGSTGYLESYSISIYTYDISTGDILSTLCATPDIVINNNPSTLGSINLNSVLGTYCSTYGYFAQHPNTYCKLVLQVSNACGSSSAVGYFVNSIATMRLGNFNKVSGIATSQTSSNKVSAVPNPFIEHSEIRFSLPEALPVTLRITDAKGQEITSLLSGEVLSAGVHRYTLEGAGLEPGLYFYQLIADQVYIGKLIKSE